MFGVKLHSHAKITSYSSSGRWSSCCWSSWARLSSSASARPCSGPSTRTSATRGLGSTPNLKEASLGKVRTHVQWLKIFNCILNHHDQRSNWGRIVHQQHFVTLHQVAKLSSNFLMTLALRQSFPLNLKVYAKKVPLGCHLHCKNISWCHYDVMVNKSL